MKEEIIKKLNEFHESYKNDIKADTEKRNAKFDVKKGADTLKPWDKLSDESRREFMEFAGHSIVAEHHKEGFIRSDEAVTYDAWGKFKALKGLK